MRTRLQVEAEAKWLSSKSAMSRSERVLLEVMLDIRDSLYEDDVPETEGTIKA